MNFSINGSFMNMLSMTETDGQVPIKTEAAVCPRNGYAKCFLHRGLGPVIGVVVLNAAPHAVMLVHQILRAD